MLKFFQVGYEKIKGALSKTRSALSAQLKRLFKNPLDEKTFEELEKILYEADLGSFLSADFTEAVRAFLKKAPQSSFEEILDFLYERSLNILEAPPKISQKPLTANEPKVILVVGVNGSGKTTSIAKLAKSFKEEGEKVLMAAGDTFRAAATEQLSIHATHLGIDLVKGQTGSDPSAVVYDALTAGKARGATVIMIDTAGRLQNKTDLMNELQKIQRTCQKVIPGSPHETFLVIDATSGQNAIDQAEIFHQFTPLSGLLLAKLDGTAKGGIALAIYKKLGIPIKWVGTGEKANDLMPFDAKSYAAALLKDEK